MVGIMLFLGTSANKIDAKGRVSVPNDFRAAIEPEDFQGVALFHSFTSRCIEGCPLSRMEKISDATDGLDLFGEEAQSINSLIFSDARKLAFDVAGRIVIPGDLVRFAGIEGEALFVGRGKTFQIWNRAEFEKHQKQARERAIKARPALIIPK
jgi:MraZ protein